MELAFCRVIYIVLNCLVLIFILSYSLFMYVCSFSQYFCVFSFVVSHSFTIVTMTYSLADGLLFKSMAVLFAVN